eukprot:284815549_2
MLCPRSPHLAFAADGWLDCTCPSRSLVKNKEKSRMCPPINPGEPSGLLRIQNPCCGSRAHFHHFASTHKHTATHTDTQQREKTNERQQQKKKKKWYPHDEAIKKKKTQRKREKQIDGTERQRKVDSMSATSVMSSKKDATKGHLLLAALSSTTESCKVRVISTRSWSRCISTSSTTVLCKTVSSGTRVRNQTRNQQTRQTNVQIKKKKKKKKKKKRKK